MPRESPDQRRLRYRLRASLPFASIIPERRSEPLGTCVAPATPLENRCALIAQPRRSQTDRVTWLAWTAVLPRRRRGWAKLTIYLDNLAYTPIDPRVAAHHAATALQLVGNPNSGEHAAGKQSRTVLEAARSDIASFVGREADDISFTPGASSALWLALRDQLSRTRTRPLRVIASAIEHPALLGHLEDAERGGEVELTLCPVDQLGQLNLQALMRLCRTGVDLICVMAANNELGSIMPIRQVLAIAAKEGARTLVDASQAAGRLSTEPFADADYLVFSGAKLYGPRNVGVLAGRLAAKSKDLSAALFGTPDVASSSAMALACSLRSAEMVEDEVRIAGYRDTMQAELLSRISGLVVNGSAAQRLAGALHVSSPDLPGEAVVARLWGKVDISTGAACRTGVPGPSHVLTAMGVDDWIAEGAIRICFGKFNREDETASAIELLAEALSPPVARKKIA